MVDTWTKRRQRMLRCGNEMPDTKSLFFLSHQSVISKTRLYTYPNKTGEQIIDEYRARVDNYNDTSNRSNLFLNVYDAVATANNLDFATPNVGTASLRRLGAGQFDVDTGAFTASSEIQWFAGTPYTKTSETYTYRTIDRTLFIAWVVFAVLGIIYALFCLLTLVLNFKKKIVKNSGPVISILIILGCILNYITVILYGFDYSRVSADQVTRLCRARSWTFAIGFTLSVGGLVAKLWMAYSVLKERFVRSRNVMMFWMLEFWFFF
ncbi:hypothetical protein OS493_015460 [Desmophyllum pertusum]|uniref:G-protein coupled receptors family 3 profile domain-containing protein n=1 Tax=Desmophyllum pertusum TaxID=174260 RepID=A0A9X0CRH9_9CNID|nr:hypothetical protein OS493_015460 [Desmophyllum pertusum]